MVKIVKSRKGSKKQITRKQKLWNMKGCSRNSKKMRGGGCGCGMPFLGGQTQNGGMKMGGSEPALIGNPWTANIKSWPGVQGIPGESNFFSLNKYQPYSPPTQIGQERDGQIFPPENVKYLVKGGRKMSRKNHSKKWGRVKKGGSSLFGENLLNTARSIQYGLGSAYNTLRGYPLPVDPQPYADQYAKNPIMNTNQRI
jgi:hypothetical protein